MAILALADDMTGALEIGAKFSEAGIETMVSAKPLAVGTASAVVLDTETRHVGSEAARREVIRFVMESAGTEPRLIYKKTDSTLRGNIAAELRALAELFPGARIGYAPAYPALGRTVKAGILYVHGCAAAETEFARDELNPISTSSISGMLHPEMDCSVFDGETDADLARTALAILADAEMRIAAGPAGLAEMIARAIDLPRRNCLIIPFVRTCLVMNGSRHERSARQMKNAAAEGWRVMETAHEQDWNAPVFAAQNARRLVRTIAREAPDAVFVIGGDTAFAVVRELGFPPMTPVFEAMPGVPVTRIAAAGVAPALPGRTRDLILITKAGGFGEDDVISRVRAKLNDGGRCNAE